MADVIIHLPLLLVLVFLREDLATCSPLITSSANTLLSDMHTRRDEDADIHGCTAMHETGFSGSFHIHPSGIVVYGCLCFLRPQTQTEIGRGGEGGVCVCMWCVWRPTDGWNEGGPYKDEARCYNNCLLMVQWMFLQLTRPECI